MEDLTISYGKKGGVKTEEDAAEAYVEHLAIFKTKINLLKERQSISFSFREYLIHWYHNIFIPHSDSMTKVINSYVLYNFILPSLRTEDDIPLTAVTTTFLNRLIKKCNDYCETSAKQCHKFLSSAFNDAQTDGLVKENPMRYAEKYFWNTPKPAVLFSKEQIRVFLDYICHFYRQIYLEVCLALFCGLRTGEIRGFCYADADPQNQTIHVQRQITANYDIRFINDSVNIKGAGISKKPPKSHSSDRVLKVHNIIFELLDERREDNKKLQTSAKNWSPCNIYA